MTRFQRRGSQKEDVFRPTERRRKGRRHAGPAAVTGVCLLMLAACRWTGGLDPAKPIKSLAEVRALTPAQARRGYPVEFHGIVTFFDSQVELLTVQDGTAGIYVEVAGVPTGLSPGQAVEVRGFTAMKPTHR